MSDRRWQIFYFLCLIADVGFGFGDFRWQIADLSGSFGKFQNFPKV